MYLNVKYFRVGSVATEVENPGDPATDTEYNVMMLPKT